ncbi:MAG: hypothetical protein M1836_007339 [Candelina mexicana]|nr:MAG: hypothetical protein M1836_007339 [Candelina mexicana]
MPRFLQLLVQWLLFQVSVVLGIPLAIETFINDFPRADWPKAPFRNTTALSSTVRNGTSSRNSTGSVHSCGDPFFVFTEENIKDSDFGNYYKDWSKTAHLHPAYNSSSDEMAFFAKQHIGWPDMKCGLSFKGCDNRPSCKDIFDLSEGDVDKARRVFFVITSTHNMIAYADNIYQALESAQSNLIMLIPDASKTFFFERDEQRYQHCQLVKWATNTLAMLALTIGIAVLGPALESMLVAGSAAQLAAKQVRTARRLEKGLESRRKSMDELHQKASKLQKSHPKDKKIAKEWKRAQEKYAKWHKAIENAAKDTEMAIKAEKAVLNVEANGLKATLSKPAPWGRMVKTDKGWKFADNRALKEMQVAAFTIVSGEITFPLTTKVEEDCLDLDANDPDPQVTNAREFSDMFGDILQGFRKYVSYSTAHLMEGSGYGESGSFGNNESSVLSSLISDGSYLVGEEQESRDKLASNPYELEEPIFRHLKATLVSEAWTTNMCYLVRVDDAAGDCHKDLGQLDGTRYCPANGTICKPQCWQNSKEKARNIELFGIGKLNKAPWNLSPEQVMLDSWHNYELNNLFKTHQRPMLEDLLSNPSHALEAEVLRPRATDFTLPVCRSHYLSITNYKIDEDEDQEVFPCTCGDIFSSETNPLMNVTNIAKWVGREYITKKCAKQLSKYTDMGPVQFFLAMCALHVRWPLQHHKQEEGAHPECDGVEQDARAIYDTTFDIDEANRQFCQDSRVMKSGEFIEDEFFKWRNVWGFKDVPTFEERCEDYINRTAADRAGNRTEATLHGIEEHVKGAITGIGPDLWHHYLGDNDHKNNTDFQG